MQRRLQIERLESRQLLAGDLQSTGAATFVGPLQEWTPAGEASSNAEDLETLLLNDARQRYSHIFGVDHFEGRLMAPCEVGSALGAPTLPVHINDPLRGLIDCAIIDGWTSPVEDIAADDTHIFAANDNSKRLRIFESNADGRTPPVAQVPLRGRPLRIIQHEQSVIAISDRHPESPFLQIIDVTDQSSPSVAQQWAFQGQFVDAIVMDGQLILIFGRRGFFLPHPILVDKEVYSRSTRSDAELWVRAPDGQRFETFVEYAQRVKSEGTAQQLLGGMQLDRADSPIFSGGAEFDSLISVVTVDLAEQTWQVDSTFAVNNHLDFVSGNNVIYLIQRSSNSDHRAGTSVALLPQAGDDLSWIRTPIFNVMAVNDNGSELVLVGNQYDPGTDANRGHVVTLRNEVGQLQVVDESEPEALAPLRHAAIGGNAVIMRSGDGSDTQVVQVQDDGTLSSVQDIPVAHALSAYVTRAGLLAIVSCEPTSTRSCDPGSNTYLLGPRVSLLDFSQQMSPRVVDSQVVADPDRIVSFRNGAFWDADSDTLVFAYSRYVLTVKLTDRISVQDRVQHTEDARNRRVVRSGDQLLSVAKSFPYIEVLTATVNPPRIRGDVNGDRVVSVIDMLALVNYLNRLDRQPNNPPVPDRTHRLGESSLIELDQNQDGIVSVMDAHFLLPLISAWKAGSVSSLDADPSRTR